MAARPGMRQFGQETRASSESLTWVAGAYVLGPSSASFPRYISQGAGLGSAAAGTRTDTYMGS